jgi:hypothetical protein
MRGALKLVELFGACWMSCCCLGVDRSHTACDWQQLHPAVAFQLPTWRLVEGAMDRDGVALALPYLQLFV